jgi:glycosyltransferase involved in cell wall biosynthesis
MKILSISHSCVISEYQKRMAEVAQYPEIGLTLLVPNKWTQFNRAITLEKDNDRNYAIVSNKPMSWGLKQNTLRNVTHIYPGTRRLLTRLKPDIVELWEEPFSAVSAHTIFWTKRIVPGARIIFSSAQNVFKRYPFPFSAFEKYTYENAAHAFLVNEEVSGIVRRKGFEKGSTILPLGLDTDFFCKKDVSSLKKNLGLRDFVIGFIGKINKQKGIFDLIKAVSEIKERIQLLIIGNGELKGEAEHFVTSFGLGQKTVLMDAVSHSHVPNFLNCMDALVVPSISLPNVKEQFGRVIIEAMACEVPVLGSDSGEIPATIARAGLIFKEGDVRDLKEKIEGLMRNRDLRASLTKKGRERVLENFSWKVIAKRQHQVYTELMSGGNDLPDRQFS